MCGRDGEWPQGWRWDPFMRNMWTWRMKPPNSTVWALFLTLWHRLLIIRYYLIINDIMPLLLLLWFYRQLMWWLTKFKIFLVILFKIMKTMEISGGGIMKPSMNPNTVIPETKLWKTPGAFTRRLVKKSQNKSHTLKNKGSKRRFMQLCYKFLVP